MPQAGKAGSGCGFTLSDFIDIYCQKVQIQVQKLAFWGVEARNLHGNHCLYMLNINSELDFFLKTAPSGKQFSCMHMIHYFHSVALPANYSRTCGVIDGDLKLDREARVDLDCLIFVPFLHLEYVQERTLKKQNRNSNQQIIKLNPFLLSLVCTSTRLSTCS